MRLCKECCNSVSLTTVRCERCARLWPAYSRRALRRMLIRFGMAGAAIGALAAFALAT